MPGAGDIGSTFGLKTGKRPLTPREEPDDEEPLFDAPAPAPAAARDEPVELETESYSQEEPAASAAAAAEDDLWSSAVAELEAEASSAADRIMRTWLPMMFGGAELHELCVAYGVAPAQAGEDYEALFARLGGAFTEAHLSQLSRPPGGLVPLLLEGEAVDEAGGSSARHGWSGKLDMYWRGALSLHKMQLPMLRSLLQKRPHLHDYLAVAAEAESLEDEEERHETPTEDEMGAVSDPAKEHDGLPQRAQTEEQEEATQEEATQEEEPKTQEEEDKALEPRLKLRMIQALLPEYTMVAETPEYHAKRKEESEKRKKKMRSGADDADAESDGGTATAKAGSKPPARESAAAADPAADDEEEPEEVLSRAKMDATHDTVTQPPKPPMPKKPEQPPVSSDDFSAAGTFTGAREGWVFSTGQHGVGYYRDTSQHRKKHLSAAAKTKKKKNEPVKKPQEAKGQEPGGFAKDSAAAHTYDKGYKKWENFDADAAEAELDSDDDGAAGTDDSPKKSVQIEPEPAQTDTDPVVEPVASATPEPSTAAGWKEAGTVALKTGRFDDAASAYRKALTCLPPRPPPRDDEEDQAEKKDGDDPLNGSGGGSGQLSEEQMAAYERKVAEVEVQEAEKAKKKKKLNAVEEMRLGLTNNLALVSLRKEDWAGTIKMADSALELEPASAKAFYRRGVARFELQLQEENRSGEQEPTEAMAKQAWTDLVKAQALLPADKGLAKKVKEVDKWLRDHRAVARAVKEAGAREQQIKADKSKWSADYSRFDDFDPATDSDDEDNAASVERERVSRMAKLDELKGMIERSGDDQGSLDKAMDWVSKAAQENEGRRIVLNMTTSDGSRRASFGIGQRAHFTKLFEKFGKMVIPSGSAGEQTGEKKKKKKKKAGALRFQTAGGEVLKSSDTPDMFGLGEGDTIVVFVD